MLKIKGEIVDICMLLDDSDDKIKEQVKLFLHELHSKGQNIIYNLFPNAIHRLSVEFSDLKCEEFENIAKSLLEFVQKDKQKEAILEKLIQKLRNNTSDICKIEWRNSSFCLTLMKLNEKLVLKIMDMYEFWKERMLDSKETK
jgi:condensin complex subunit 1